MIVGNRKADLVAELKSDTHSFLSGLAQTLGGHDEGPDPHLLLEASLAACTVLTAQLYANRKGMKLDSCDVTVRIAEEGAETKIVRDVVFRGALSAEDRDRLAQIVGKCPIHKLLQSHVTIQTTVSEH